MEREYRNARFEVRFVDDDLAIEAASAQQRLVENLRAIRCRHHRDAARRIETVHLGQQLIQRLFAFVVSAEARPDAARTADCVEFVDEHDARRFFARLFEQLAHAGSTNSDEHLDELGTADVEERHPRFAGYGAREQRLAGSRRAEQQNPFRHPATEALNARRILQELDDLLQFLLRLIGAGDVVERDLGAGLRMNVHAIGADVEESARRPAHAPAHPVPEQEHEPERHHPAEQEIAEPVAFVLHAVTDPVRCRGPWRGRCRGAAP